jgi:hypothetical protein
MDTIGGHHIKWSKSDLKRWRLQIFPHTWEIDTIWIKTLLWKTGYTKERSLTGEEGEKKEVKKVYMGDVLPIQEWL